MDNTPVSQSSPETHEELLAAARSTSTLCRSLCVLQALSDELSLTSELPSDLDERGMARSVSSIAAVYSHVSEKLPAGLHAELTSLLPELSPGATLGETRAFLAGFNGWLGALYQTATAVSDALVTLPAEAAYSAESSSAVVAELPREPRQTHGGYL